MKSVKNTFWNVVMINHDHIVETFDSSILQMDTFLWKNPLNEDDIPNLYIKSKYFLNPAKIIKKVFRNKSEIHKILLKKEADPKSSEGEIILSFNSNGNIISSKSSLQQDLCNIRLFKYDENDNLILVQNMNQSGYVIQKWLYQYDVQGNLIYSKYYIDDDTGSGRCSLEEEATYVYDAESHLIYEKSKNNYCHETEETIYEFTKNKVSILKKYPQNVDLSITERVYNEKSDLTSTHYMDVEYKYDGRNNYVERRIYDKNKVLSSLTKRKLTYRKGT